MATLAANASPSVATITEERRGARLKVLAARASSSLRASSLMLGLLSPRSVFTEASGARKRLGRNDEP